MLEEAVFEVELVLLELLEACGQFSAILMDDGTVGGAGFGFGLGALDTMMLPSMMSAIECLPMPDNSCQGVQISFDER